MRKLGCVYFQGKSPTVTSCFS